MSQKVVIQNPCRLSYPHLFQPKEGLNGGNPNYGCTILIPKSDTETVTAINTAIQAEYAEASQPNGKWKGAAPQQPTITLYDGDGVTPSGEPWGDECKGHLVLRTTSAVKPEVVDRNCVMIMDATKFYAGCYCYFSVNFAAYNNSGNKGIGAFLNCVMFAHDGDPLEARSSAKSDFASIMANQPAQAPSAPAVGGFGAPGIPGMPSFGAAPAPAQPAPAAPAYQAPYGAGQPGVPGMVPPAAAPQMQPPMGFGGFPGGFVQK